ncbi:MAG TPA: cache domain-containing protein [Anaerolineales bacterium]|nr:cache domain-containing protein [Anaerolineales bacterium]
MKVLSAIFGLMVLIATQLACNFGSQPSNAAPQQPPAGQTAPTATKGERGTPDEAKAMLQLAIQHYQQAGRDQALADFNNGASPFKDRDLYVVCMDANQTETANGGFPQYVGTSANLLMDTSGNPLGKTVWAKASTDSVNSVDYHWVNPVSGETEPKTLFFQKVGTDVCGVGAYNP